MIDFMMPFFRFVIVMVYYGLTLNITNLSGDIFQNFAISVCLEALADLVPLLGADVVVGGKKRGRIFADGEPSNARQINTVHSLPNLKQVRTIFIATDFFYFCSHL